MRPWTTRAFLVCAGTLLLFGRSPTFAAPGGRPSGQSPADRVVNYRGVRTESFIIRYHPPSGVEAEIADTCESLRRELQTRWLGELHSAWQPRCEVVWHTSRESYLQAVGRGGAMTSGSSRVSFDGNRVCIRRVDLRGDSPDRARSALAHELTHVVLADRFGAGGLPRWADEGSAVLADSVQKQSRHHRDLMDAVEANRSLFFGELAAVATPPSGDRVAIFYGQAASMVRFLAEQKSPTDFVRFIDIANRAGYDQAAREVYGYTSVRDLESAWRSSLAHQGTDLAKIDDSAAVGP